ncbi:hypothetical protein SteCoe_11412 [Stentor coeruleus]|uniref:Uncharacterized protein n=1 Tax=Stentor coeruleus TaxID=5963 RepID=A0A1R2CD42_9CILI|nr:hypothetical protein SteCoe_11412 [Stentor coeruleus]
MEDLKPFENLEGSCKICIKEKKNLKEDIILCGKKIIKLEQNLKNTKKELENCNAKLCVFKTYVKSINGDLEKAFSYVNPYKISEYSEYLKHMIEKIQSYLRKKIDQDKATPKSLADKEQSEFYYKNTEKRSLKPDVNKEFIDENPKWIWNEPQEIPKNSRQTKENSKSHFINQSKSSQFFKKKENASISYHNSTEEWVAAPPENNMKQNQELNKNNLPVPRKFSTYSQCNPITTLNHDEYPYNEYHENLAQKSVANDEEYEINYLSSQKNFNISHETLKKQSFYNTKDQKDFERITHLNVFHDLNLIRTQSVKALNNQSIARRSVNFKSSNITLI